MAPEPRTEQFGLRITSTEAAMLYQLVEKSGLSAADIVRQLIRREYEEKFGDKPPKKPKK
jgi:ribosomal 50S subunit-associated protein YjgA (DUF615 family)